MADETKQTEGAARRPPTVRLYAMLAVGLAPLVLALILGGFWITDRTPRWVYWEIGLVGLLGLDFAYAAAVGLAVVVAPVLIWRGRGRTGVRHRRTTLRGLSICFSIGLAATLAEAGAGLWLARLDRSDVISIGATRSYEPRLPGAVEIDELPMEFPDDPNDGTIVVTMVGESSAAGIPYDRWLSAASIVGWRLGQEISDKKFTHQIVAASGDTLEGQFKKLKSMTRRPDVLIVYCGHNEFSARIAASRDLDYYDDAQDPSPWETAFERATRWSFFHALVRRNAARCRIAIPPPSNGYRAAVDAPAYTESEYARLLSDFKVRLDAVAAYAERLGAVLVLIAPPANDSGFDPNRSFLPAATTRADRRAFENDLDAARRLESTDPDAAIEGYRALVDRRPGFAAAHYRLARLLEAKGAWDEVYHHDRRARDADGFPMRCLTPFQEAYRETAARHDCIYIDGQNYFHAIGVHGLLDDSLFHDGMHPSLRGQVALAQAVLRGLHARRAFGWPADAPAPTVDPLACIRHFGIDPGVWRYLCLWGIMFHDRTSGATYDPSRRLARRWAFVAAADKIEAGAAPEAAGLRNIGAPQPVPLAPYGEPFSLRPSRSP